MSNLLPSARVGVVSHDAGGAEIISAYLRRNKLDCVYSIAGPAVGIFEKKLGAINLCSLEECLTQSDWLLCSMGWSDHEWQALVRGQEAGMPVTVFLDHWTGYRARFERDGVTHKPDFLWVGDNDAAALAKEAFPDVPVKLVPNPYYAELKDELESMPRQIHGKDIGKRILYVCEPTAALTDSVRSSGYTDHDALRYFFECLKESGDHVDTVSLRPHPTESFDKYAWALDETWVKVKITGDRPLLEEIVDSDWVVGRNSMALVIGILANKRVISCIPSGGKKCELPQAEIEHLQLLRNCISGEGS